MAKFILKKIRGMLFPIISILCIILLYANNLEYDILYLVIVIADIIYLVISAILPLFKLEVIPKHGYSICIADSKGKAENDNDETHVFIINNNNRVITGTSVVQLKSGGFGYVAGVSTEEEHVYMIDPDTGSARRIVINNEPESNAEDLIDEDIT